VPSTDSLYLSYVDLRPLHWTSVLGARSRMAIEFTADSAYGGTSGPSGNQNIVLAHGRDLLAGAAMTEVVLQLVPHRVGRVDSVSVLAVDLGSARIVPGALSVDGEQDLGHLAQHRAGIGALLGVRSQPGGGADAPGYARPAGGGVRAAVGGAAVGARFRFCRACSGDGMPGAGP